MKMGIWMLLWCTLWVWTGCKHEPETKASTAPPVAPVSATPGLVALPPDSPMLTRIRVEPVRTRELPTEEVTAPSKVEANSQRLARVSLPVTGHIANVLVQLGDLVTQGQPLLTIESPDADAAMSTFLQAEASMTQATATLEKARVDLARLTDMYAHDAAAKREVLDAQNAVTQAQAAREQSEAARTQAQRRLALLGLKPGGAQPRVVVRAPLSGTVLELSVVPGEYRNDPTVPVMSIADLGTVWVSSDVPESAIRLIQVGERVEIRLVAYPGETFEGRVTRIADTVDLQTRTVKVRAELANPHKRFRPGMFGSMRHIEAVQPLPIVPAGAVVQGTSHTSVFVERSPGQFQETPVTVGQRVEDSVPILTGLKAGERVVVDGAMLLRNNVRAGERHSSFRNGRVPSSPAV